MKLWKLERTWPRELVKLRTIVVATLAAAATFATSLVINDSQHDLAAAFAKQPIPALLLVKKATGDCTLYGSGCLGAWANLQHGVDGDPATADVLVVGDSIVTRCRPYLRKRLAASGLSVVFDYWSGRPAEPAVTRALSYSRIHQPGTFKVVVMPDGTNDIFDPTGMSGQIQRMQILETRLLWGTVYSARAGTYSADLRNSGWVNGQIHASGVATVDWFVFLAAYPGYRIPAYLADGTHPTYDATEPQLGDGTGCDAWAALYTGKIVTAALP